MIYPVDASLQIVSQIFQMSRPYPDLDRSLQLVLYYGHQTTNCLNIAVGGGGVSLSSCPCWQTG